ncbi:MAG: 5'/3'-nucleotidase SurE [Bacteroidetes bacterium GWE2_29_8]|nr:MAG: 5'/3'-nucleotidase SurE [Bacteroidetes bacterium GWE2_29_8]OFY24494.1 MAG: 5'/3'-nucleotidase SurE [Bacteroidetes bacterium GWF2_29_10]
MNKRPKILITNDDGINAKGIRRLIEFVKDFADVVVFAPNKPQSGMGHAVTINNPIKFQLIQKDKFYAEYSCSGTPVDCIKLAFDTIYKRTHPDLCISGINHGSNSSVNLLYSGTMAAAIEAAMANVPAIGFSLLDFAEDANFDLAKEYIVKIIKNVLTNGLKERTCLNVNIPKGKIKGIKVVRQSKAYWVETFEERYDPYKRPYYWMLGEFINLDEGNDTDEHALKNAYISIVPIQLDLTCYESINMIKKWDLKT